MDIDKYTRSGRSTGLALKYISEAYNNPGQYIHLNDHGLEGVLLRRQAPFVKMVYELVQRLQLSGFQFDMIEYGLIYEQPQIIKDLQKGKSMYEIYGP